MKAVPLLLIGAALSACGPYEGAPPETPDSVPAEAPLSVMVVSGAGEAVQLEAFALAPRWRGEWVTPTGYRCAFDLELGANDTGVLAGRFRWKLLDAPAHSSQRQRIGRVASEWVRGSYDPVSREIHLVGYEVDDPEMLITDEYRLALDATGATFTGKSRGQSGLWRDQLRGGALD